MIEIKGEKFHLKFGSENKNDTAEQSLNTEEKRDPKSYVYTYPAPYSPIIHVPFDGEKTPGEMGAAKNYRMMYPYLRTRSWQSFTESEISQSVLKKHVLWVIGQGLKLQCEPCPEVLEQEKINIDTNSFARLVGSRFNVWGKSRHVDFSKMMCLDQLAFEAFKNAIIGGDVLVICRLIDNNFSIQLVDGYHVTSPTDPAMIKAIHETGNTITYGVEQDANGEQVAYYVRDDKNTYKRIPRLNADGEPMAFLIYGLRYRIDDSRGMPLITAVLETLRKLDRYKEATVGSAEERQKIAFFIEHGINSTGEHPLIQKMQQAANIGMANAPETKVSNEISEQFATRVATTTNKQVFNMPIDSQMKILESKNELYFKDFYTTNIMLVCAAIGIPYEVAMSMFNSNYSASRAAIKDWEYCIKTARNDFSRQFYQPIFNMWLQIEILKNKIQAPGFIKSYMDKNYMAIEAYRNARWIGVNVPHIDPLKEVQAERAKLGDQTTPLTTYDQVTESLGSGDFAQTMEKVAQEKKMIPIKKEKLKTAEPNEKDN